MDLWHYNCEWKFKSNHNVDYVKCSNCLYKIRISGNGRKGGSRILVNKFSYDFGEPSRWDVAVFKYPFGNVTCMSCGFSSSQSMMCEKCTNSPKREHAKLPNHTSRSKRHEKQLCSFA